MSTVESRDGSATAVTIYGQTYYLRGEDGAYLTELAKTVDRRMREVVEATGTADTLKVAILAALNTEDNYLRARRARNVPTDEATGERLDRMITLLDEALAE